MNLLSPVSTIMTKKLITLSPNDTLSEVREIFSQHRIHHILIMKDNRLQGIVSKSDYLFFCKNIDEKDVDLKAEDTRHNKYKVSDIMTEGIATLNPNDKINVALEIFKENLFHSIPVKDEDAVVGIVTPYDIIKTLSEDKVATNSYS